MTIAAARFSGAPVRKSPPLGVDSGSAGYLSSAIATSLPVSVSSVLLLAVLLLTLGI